MIQNLTVTNVARTEAASVLNLTYLTLSNYMLYGAIIDYNSAFVYTPASGLTTTKSNKDLKVLFRLTTQTHCLKLQSNP